MDLGGYRVRDDQTGLSFFGGVLGDWPHSMASWPFGRIDIQEDAVRVRAWLPRPLRWLFQFQNGTLTRHSDDRLAVRPWSFGTAFYIEGPEGTAKSAKVVLFNTSRLTESLRERGWHVNQR